jgi:hypothetical protein
MSAFRRLSLALLIALGACARSDALGDDARPVAPEQAKALDQAYWTLLKAEKCARRATDQQAVADQLFRTSRIAARAQAAGLGQRLLDTQARWLHFDETADWVCGNGDRLAVLASAVDAFDKSVGQAVAHR